MQALLTTFSVRKAQRGQYRDWMLARITKVEERVVKVEDDDEDNPFHLSGGLRWFMVDAVKEQSGAPSTPGFGQSTVVPTLTPPLLITQTRGYQTAALPVNLVVLFPRAHEVVGIRRPGLSLGAMGYAA